MYRISKQTGHILSENARSKHSERITTMEGVNVELFHLTQDFGPIILNIAKYHVQYIGVSARFEVIRHH